MPGCSPPAGAVSLAPRNGAATAHAYVPSGPFRAPATAALKSPWHRGGPGPEGAPGPVQLPAPAAPPRVVRASRPGKTNTTRKGRPRVPQLSQSKHPQVRNFLFPPATCCGHRCSIYGEGARRLPPASPRDLVPYNIGPGYCLNVGTWGLGLERRFGGAREGAWGALGGPGRVLLPGRRRDRSRSASAFPWELSIPELTINRRKAGNFLRNAKYFLHPADRWGD